MGEAGSLWNYPDKVVEKPCSTCVIVGMNAGLEYANGKNANIDTGLWLHHVSNWSEATTPTHGLLTRPFLDRWSCSPLDLAELTQLA
jgi:hypothetical protein